MPFGLYLVLFLTTLATEPNIHNNPPTALNNPVCTVTIGSHRENSWHTKTYA